ncbi:hypothetical protein HNR01_001752 [Methylorubrum rhodesianum]|uniref:VRR-NUC domain-containing protein n=1 Tax=Methylorubrum rhodesianum TaxID=29427 RepID=UPI001610AC5E|nr:VRR-NUC domain-containing protein [Methylorubrum rhodesianum]MBB5762132.1 hypothetical protein [Methylorubrum rhodesianum]
MTRAFRLTAPRTSDEDDIQRAIVRYLRHVLPAGFIVQSTANKPRSAVAGAREKSMGAVAGWPDLAVYGQAEDENPTAWFIEVKTPAGRLSDVQHDVHDRLKLAGFKVAVARSVDDVRDLVRAWGLPSRDTYVRRSEAA